MKIASLINKFPILNTKNTEYKHIISSAYNIDYVHLYVMVTAFC